MTIKSLLLGALTIIVISYTLAGQSSPTKRDLKSMADDKRSFDFEAFERLREGQAQAAQEKLNEQFPRGSDARTASDYLAGLGAKCEFLKYNGYFYFCKYTRPGHGLMALVSSIEWQVGIHTDTEGRVVEHITVGRFATGT